MELLASWREKVRELPTAAALDSPTIDDQVPQLLEKLTEALSGENTEAETNAISTEHGLIRWQAGFDVTEVVAEYNMLRQCLHDAAERQAITVSGKALKIINSIFDDAIGNAVKAFETMTTIELQHKHDEHMAFVLHDLRTPLEALSLGTTFLERSLPHSVRNSEIDSAISVLRNNISRLSLRVRHVLSSASGFKRSIKPQFSVLTLRSEVQKIIIDLEPLTTATQTQVRNNIEDHLTIYTDELLLAQVMQNLLSNAIKFAAGGVIEVGARVTNDANWLECWVKDSGCGIPADQLERVFDRFETTSVKGENGVGLGLAIVREIVELQKGKIRVQSEVGRGSTFTFSLPSKEPG